MSSALLPPNSTDMERAAADAIAEAIAIPTPLRDLWSPERCPEAFLPHLAWTLSVDTWDTAWPVEMKRNVIAASIEIHRVKGTPAAIKRALAAFGYGDATVTEGVNAERYDGSAVYDGAKNYGQAAHWASYRVFMSRPVTNAQAAHVRAALDLLAPARCELVELNFIEAALIYDGTATHDGAFNHGVA